MIDELELPVENAELIIEKAIEAGVYSDDMPESDKDKIEAAHEQLAFMIDSVKDDDVTPDAKDPDIAKAGEQIYEIFEVAGIEVEEGKKGREIVFGEVPEVTDEDDDEEEDDFDPDSVISGYAKKSATTIVKAFEKGDIDADDIAKVQAWEKEEGKGREQIVDWEPEEAEDEDGEEEGEGMTRADLNDLDRAELKQLIKDNELDITVKKSWDDDELRDKIAEVAELPDGDTSDDEEEDDEDEAGDESEQPWEDYDGETVKSIKETIEAAKEDEDDPLTEEQVQGVIDYEEANKGRASLVKWLEAVKEEIGQEPEDEDAPDDEEEPEEKSTKKTTKKADVTAADPGSGSITLTRDQILTALAEGEVEIEV